jgi:UDP-N-acetylglucosamine--N-acetylmuramyl-(pentapeptide) pyrophosphoryl-undecaprenol N-acetylglucosamine transferase
LAGVPLGKGVSSPTFAIIAGGGTAGHVVPALAIGRALVARGHPVASIHYVGSRRGLESRLVPDAGFAITLLPGRGVARRLSVQSAAAVASLAWAVVQAVVLMARRRPAVVASVGGYASVACDVAAGLLRVPLIVAEQNAVPGLANRLAGRVARASAVSFEGTRLPRAVVTGNPVRPEILAIDRSPAGMRAAREALGLPVDRAVVAAFGGSLGSRRINDAVLGLVAAWADRTDLVVRHIVGARDWEVVSGQLPELPAGGLVYQPVRYEDRMDQLLQAADVAVCRAGGSVAELAATGIPAVLVPLPGAPGDHQSANARAFEAAGAAVVVADGALSPGRLASELSKLLGNDERLAEMGRAARSLAHVDAAERVADLVEEYAKGG